MVLTLLALGSLYQDISFKQHQSAHVIVETATLLRLHTCFNYLSDGFPTSQKRYAATAPQTMNRRSRRQLECCSG